MKYDVHLYETVRVKLEEVEAESPREALERAEASLDKERYLNRYFPMDDGSRPRVAHVEHADETPGYVVDEVGDEEHLNTRVYEYDLGLVGKGRNLRPVAEVHQELEGVKHLLSAAEKLTAAYALGLAKGGSIQWEDLDEAHRDALAGLKLVYPVTEEGGE